MRTHYEPEMTMQAARDRYFAVNGFGADGGYSDPWVDFKLGPIPMPFPNTKGRVRAVGYHDLHHVVTGYDTDTLGEFEISAWEIAAGCKNVGAAWVLNLAGMGAGLFAAPRRTLRAFLRGARMETLYGRDLNELLGKNVGEVRALVTEADPRPIGNADHLRWGAASLLGVAVALGLTALVLPLVPIGIATLALRRWRQNRAAAI